MGSTKAHVVVRGRPVAGPEISPNGELVAAAIYPSQGTAVHPLVIVRSDGGPVIVAPKALQIYGLSLFAFSPDSRYLAVAFDPTVGAHGLAVLDLEHDRITTVVSGDIFGASFRPGGTPTLVFSRSAAGAGRYDLYSTRADGAGRPQRLTTTGRAISPVWGPKGIVFSQESAIRSSQAYSVALLQDERTTIVSAPRGIPFLTPVAVSSDGTHVLLDSATSSSDAAYSLALPSGRPVRLGPAGDRVSPEGISRDGRRALITLFRGSGPSAKPFVATIPIAGGPPRVLRPGFATSWTG